MAGRSDPEARLPQGGLGTAVNLKENATTSQVVIVHSSTSRRVALIYCGNYRHLSLSDRIESEKLLDSTYYKTMTAAQLGCHRSTISREFRHRPWSPERVHQTLSAQGNRFHDATQGERDESVQEINNRPRKALG